jgi:hypothetical protein
MSYRTFIAIAAAAILGTTTAASAYTRHHHRHHAHVPTVAHAQADPRVTKSMETLKAMTATLGKPKLEGQEAVGSKEAPTLYFGTTKFNNNFDIVDAVGTKDGQGMTATRATNRSRIGREPRLMDSSAGPARTVPTAHADLACT